MIRKLLKWFIYLCLLILAGIVVLILCKDTLIRNITERRILKQTGMYVRIDRVHVGFTRPVIAIEGLKLYNRPEFGKGLLLHLPELYLEYDPEALRSGELHLTELRLNLEELNVVRNAAGQTNLTGFIQDAGTEGRDALSRKLPGKDFGFTGIDELNLSLGRIRYIDLGYPRRNREAYFGVKDCVIKNIRDEDDLYGVAAIVLIRSGLVNMGNAPQPGETRSSILDLGLDWLRQQFGLDGKPAASTGDQTAPKSSP